MSLAIGGLSKFIQGILSHTWMYPTPSSLGLMSTFGSLAGLSLVIQILTGVFLSMHYVAEIGSAFDSVEHIMRDVVGGAFLRYVHANGASFFFFNIYLHMARSIFYQSFVKNKQAWFIGLAIFLGTMASAFIGYVLPWGQMSFWGATVITNLFSVIPGIGESLVSWIWGGFGVGGPTLNRFFTLHFLVPFLVLVLVVVHILVLHSVGSSTPHVNNHSAENISFGRFFIVKDLFLNSMILVVLAYIVLVSPNYLNHPDNFIPANPMQTPPHIVPEWYFLPFYAILRSVPNKLLGVVGMFTSIVFLVILPFANSLLSGPTVRTSYVSVVWCFFVIILLLTYLGSQPVSYPYVQMGFYASIGYFVAILGFWVVSFFSWRRS